jgi:hypothetical protein
MSDDGEQKYLRAREVLRDSGWLLDEFINAEMRKILTSKPADAAAREEAYTYARVATELKRRLTEEVDEYEGGQLTKEFLHGRRNQHTDA